jgi:hypothetical protein
MKSVLSGTATAAILSVAVAATGVVGISSAMPATAAKSYNLKLTKLPANAVSVSVLVKKTPDDWNATKKACFKGTGGRDINTHLTVAPGQAVATKTYPTNDCRPHQRGGTRLGTSADQGSVPPSLSTVDYLFKAGPPAPRHPAPHGMAAG